MATRAMGKQVRDDHAGCVAIGLIKKMTYACGRGFVTHAQQQVNAAAVVTEVDWEQLATELDVKSPLEIMDHVRGALWCAGRPTNARIPGAQDVWRRHCHRI